MPDFKSLQDWYNHDRHLDLFCFLWLHPEIDESLLKSLRNEYVTSPLVLKEDVMVGIRLFVEYATLFPAGGYSEEKTLTMLSTHGNNELYFRVIFGDLDVPNIPEDNSQSWSISKKRAKLENLIAMTFWLCNEKVIPYNEECLYPSELYLDYWYWCFPTNEDLFNNPKSKKSIPVVELALFRIHHFDTEKEGDTCRTRFVKKIRKILDERDFISVFKQMWLDVKEGKIEIENPWKR